MCCTSLGVVEPQGTAVFLIVLGTLMAFSVLASRIVERMGVPVVLLFLILGMLGGSEGIGRIAFADYALAERLGTAALVLILFDGGLNTPLDSIRRVIAPTAVLGTVGVAATAGLVALFARMLRLSWGEALLLGAVVSSTDAAAVFAVLRGGNLNLRWRVGAVIEVESCVNDPMAVILTTTIVAALTARQRSVVSALIGIPVQLIVGTAIGASIGWLTQLLLRRVKVSTAGLLPVLTLSVALLSYGVATVSWGSGFLSAYVTAVVLGNGALPYRSGLARVHDALGWLSQIGMFLMLGLLVFPSHLPAVARAGLLVGMFLALVARPLAVLLCLALFRFPLREALYIGWVGLRGAVPIVLATFPVLAGVRGSERLFDLVFFIVVVSTIIPGATIRAVTHWLRMAVPHKPEPSAMLEILSSRPLGARLVSFHIEPTVAVCGALLSEIEFPPGASVVLVARGNELMAARGRTQLHASDHVFVFFKEEDRPLIELLFGRPQEM
jgi:cell volume regulation protein A